MLQEQPFFMTNKEWYYHDKKKNKFFLTDKAPKEAQDSYKKFYAEDDVDIVFFDEVMKEVEKRKRQHLQEEGKSPEEIEKIIYEWKHTP